MGLRICCFGHRLSKVAGSPVVKRQLHYFEQTMLDSLQADFSHIFRKRGGCCRYYLTEGRTYCAICMLKNPEYQTEEYVSQCFGILVSNDL
ncbi:hypothetical protein C8J34_10973 [Rhizobium sp. PP-F2F-G36]|nr:hypothetical protein C8J34_10973 [Rhizobium sp. PP-F2F-G36]